MKQIFTFMLTLLIYSTSLSQTMTWETDNTWLATNNAALATVGWNSSTTYNTAGWTAAGPGYPTGSQTTATPTAAFIWSNNFWTPYQTVYFRKVVTLPNNGLSHSIIAKADDAFDIWVNGVLIGSGNNWQTTYTFNATAPTPTPFIAGDNVIAIRGRDLAAIRWWVSASITVVVQPLPIKLLSFEGSINKKNNQSLLQWEISNTSSCHYFEIERLNQQQAFQSIGDKAPYTEGETQYQFTDNFPVYGKNTYRLKTTDIDGSISYSDKVVELTFETPPTRIALYPNPAEDYLTIKTNFEDNKNILVNIIDINGRTIENLSLTGENGIYQLALQNLSAGVYLLKILDTENGIKYYDKFAKK